MTTEEKFHAAVNVIRNLPKSGSYQPSHDLMLRFYSYFKQATEGPCKQPKPGFWDVVKKAKWDAWKRLGNMSKEDAMNGYVDELKKIVETMAYNDNVETFMGSLDTFYENMPAQELDMILGPVIEKVRSQPGSPLNKSPLGGSPTEKSPLMSRDVSPARVLAIENGKVPGVTNSDPVNGKNPRGGSNGKLSTSKSSKTKFYAPLDDRGEPPSSLVESKLSNKKYSEHNSSSSSSGVLKPKSALVDSLSENLNNIQSDLTQISERIKRLEMLSKLLAVQRSESSAWSLIRNNLPIVGFLVLWPILTQLLSLYIQTRRRASR